MIKGPICPPHATPSGCTSTHPGMQCSLLSCVSCLSCSQLPLMNQWKDEFKAHSRVKCPNSGCWLEFPSIYGLKYHYQRCQGVRRPESCLSFPVASSYIAINRVKPLSGLKPQEKCEVKMGRAQMGRGWFVRCIREGLGSLEVSVRSGLGGSWTIGKCLEGQKGVCACIRKSPFYGLTSVLTYLTLLPPGCDLREADVFVLLLRSCLHLQNPARKASALESLGPASANQQSRKQSAEGHWEEQWQEKVPGCGWAAWW